MSLHQRLTSTETDGSEVERKIHRRQILRELSAKIHHVLIEELGPELYRQHLQRADVEAMVRDKLAELVRVQEFPLSDSERKHLIGMVSDDVLGYGPIEALLADPDVSEIMVNGPERIYVERAGCLTAADIRFTGEEHLRRVIDKIVGQVGRRIDESVPMVDARLSDGSRVNAIIPPLAIDGAKLTIRKFAKEPYVAADFVTSGTFTSQLSAFLGLCVQGRLNILISGGTGSGKTTTLNVVSGYIPEDERVVTIEDAVELQLPNDHTIRLESRPPNIEGSGQITIRDLVRNALRMRPDRIIVGEVRGGEALDMLQAMNTGHDGSLSTIHANSPRDVISRLETMVLMAGMELPVRAIREQISSAIDLIIHQSRLKDGTRRVTHVTEVSGMEGDIVTLQDIFVIDSRSGLTIKPTGIRPSFVKKLHDLGVEFPAEVFDSGYLRRSV